MRAAAVRWMKGECLYGMNVLVRVMEAGGRRVKIKAMVRLGPAWYEALCVMFIAMERKVGHVEVGCLFIWGSVRTPGCFILSGIVHQLHVIRNCVKTTAKPRLSWEWSVQLVRFLFLYHLQHKLNPIHHDWLNSSTKTLPHLTEKLLQMSMDILWMGLWEIYREYGWWKKLVRRENRGLTGVYHAKFNCLISEEEHLGFILSCIFTCSDSGINGKDFFLLLRLMCNMPHKNNKKEKIKLNFSKVLYIYIFIKC